MATLILNQVPDSLYQALKERAAAHRRSINGEAIVCLEKALTPQPSDVRSWLKKARDLRQESADFYLTDELLRAAKEDERP